MLLAIDQNKNVQSAWKSGKMAKKKQKKKTELPKRYSKNKK
jgi:hypothetical protein